MIIKRVLKGTSFEVAVKLNEIQAAHFQLLTGKTPELSIPLDRGVFNEMAALAAHFEEENGKGLT